MDIRASAVARTKKFEGSKTYFYLDTRKNVTVGVGHLLPSASSAKAVAMLRNSDNKAASDKEKTDEWQGVKDGTLDPGTDTTLNMPSPEIDRLLKADLAQSADDLAKRFPDLDKYPDDAQDALLDMMFNLGLTKFNSTEWPNLFAAVNKRDWATAADECERGDVQPARNAEIRQLFVDAAKVPLIAWTAEAIVAASDATVQNFDAVLAGVGRAIERWPAILPGGLKGIIFESRMGDLTLRVELQGGNVSGSPSKRAPQSANARTTRGRSAAKGPASKRTQGRRRA